MSASPSASMKNAPCPPDTTTLACGKRRARIAVSTMAQLSDLPFVFWDERLSTVAAERTLIEMDFSRAKRAGKIDSAAAAFILQGVLDRLQSLDSSDRTELGDRTEPDPTDAA